MCGLDALIRYCKLISFLHLTIHIGLVLTHAYKIIKYQSTIGVARDEGREGTCPQKFVKIFSGQSLCRIRAFSDKTYAIWIIFREIITKKLGNFDNFSSQIHAKFGHFVNFFLHIFSGEKCLSSYA